MVTTIRYTITKGRKWHTLKLIKCFYLKLKFSSIYTFINGPLLRPKLAKPRARGSDRSALSTTVRRESLSVVIGSIMTRRQVKETTQKEHSHKSQECEASNVGQSAGQRVEWRPGVISGYGFTIVRP